MEVIEKILNALCKIAGIFAAILLAIMTCLVFANVVTRYVIHYAIPWSEEISRFLQVWIVFIGAALVYKEDAHMGLDILVNVLPKQVRRVLAIVVDFGILYVSWLMFQGGMTLTKSQLTWHAPASGISYSWLYVVIVISQALMLIFCVTKIFYHVVSLIKNEDYPKKKEDAAV